MSSPSPSSPTPPPSNPSAPMLRPSSFSHPPPIRHDRPYIHHPPIINRPIYYGGYYPRYYEDGWWYNRPVYVTEETKKEEFNMLPIYIIGGISVLALLVALQKK